MMSPKVCNTAHMRELIDQQRQCTYTHVNTGSSRIYMHLYVPDFVSPVGLVS